jgi:hypothetical protein
MADTKDTLEARRWLHQRLAKLKEQYPQLQDPKSQQRLTEALPQLTEENAPCPEPPQETPEAAP